MRDSVEEFYSTCAPEDGLQPLSAKSYPNTRDCEHGRQRGHCPDCERDDALDEIATLRAVIDDDALELKIANEYVGTGLSTLLTIRDAISDYRAAVREKIKGG